MSTKHKNMVIFPPFEYFNWLQPTGELSWRVNIRIYLQFHLLLTFFFWQIIPVSSTTEATSWWFFSPKKWISSLCRGTYDYVKKKFFLEYVAKHSRKLHRSYGRVCIIWEIWTILYIPKIFFVNNVPRGECLLGKNYHWRGVRTGRK